MWIKQRCNRNCKSSRFCYGFVGPKSFRGFRETRPWTELENKPVYASAVTLSAHVQKLWLSWTNVHNRTGSEILCFRCLMFVRCQGFVIAAHKRSGLWSRDWTGLQLLGHVELSILDAITLLVLALWIIINMVAPCSLFRRQSIWCSFWNAIIYVIY